MFRSATLLFCCAFFVGASAAPRLAQAQSDWPQFLGPNRNGVSNEKGLLDQWPSDGPREVWRAPAGPGMSGLAISGGRLFTMLQDARQQHVLCLDAKTGEAIWKTPVAPAFRNGQGNGPRATPVVSGDAVFVFTGQGILVALNAADGDVAWSSDLVKENGGKPADYGMACSPLVVGDSIIVTIGAPQATVVAVNAKSGKQVWRAGRGLPAGYSSPALLNVGGKRQIVAFTGAACIGVEPASGELLWNYPFRTNFECNVVTPISLGDGKLFLSAGENHGSVALRFVKREGRVEAVATWESLGIKSVMRNEWQTSILHEGNLYGFDNVGGAGPISHLTCINAATGERVWQKTRFGKGNLIMADGKLFMSTIRGELVVAKATDRGYEEIGRKQVLDFTRQAPSLANGLLYLRDDEVILCLDVRKP